MSSIARSLVLSSPLLAIFTTALCVMLVELFLKKSKLTSILVFIGIFISALLSFRLYPGYKIDIWSSLFSSDNVTYLMQFFISVTVGLSIYYAYSRFKTLDSTKGDVLCLYLLSAVGMMALVASQSMLSIYMSLELTSLPLYALVASQKKDGKAIEAAVKYFIMGALASVFILFGISLLYGLTGNLNIDQIANALTLDVQTNKALALFALILLIAGASFKLALVPFHMWIPDVYAGAHPVMTLFLSAAPKIAGLAIFLRFSSFGLFDAIPISHHLLAILALLSIFLGNINALVQKDLRRLLAYSTIAHMGYATLGFVAGGHEGNAAALLYILVYSLMSIAGFSAIILAKQDKVYLMEVTDLKGLAKTTPWLAAMLMIVFFSMAGIPPAIGFISKFFIIRALLDSGFTIVAILALLLAVIGAFYYLRLIKTMFFEPPNEETLPIEVTTIKKYVYMTNSLLLLGLGLFPNLLMTACIQAL